MAKFCGMCGTPLEEGWIACPKCAHKIPEKKEEISKTQATPEMQVVTVAPAVPEAEAVRVTHVSEANIFAPPLHQEVETTAESEPQKPKKRKALKITAIVLAVLIVAGSVFGVWLFTRPKYIAAGNSTVAFSNKYGDFYNVGGKLFNIDCVEDGPLEIELAPDFIRTNAVNETKSVMVKDSLYAYTGYMDTTEAYGYGKPVDKSKIKYVYGIYKIDFVGETETEAEMWMTYEELSETLDFDFEHANDHSLESFQYSDGYIYCITYEGKLARIRTKDKTAEIIDSDVYSRSYVVNGKWIYFAGALEEDSEEVGIFKMKTDGSKKELLYELDIVPAESEFVNLSMYKNRIYFIDFSDSEDRVICRMNKSGKKVEEIASGDIWAYTIDEKRDKLYYFEDIRLDYGSNGGFNSENRVYEVSLKDFSSEYLFSVYNGMSRSTLSVSKETLFISGNFFINGVYPSADSNRRETLRIQGIIYDIKEEKLNALKQDDEGVYYLETIDWE